MSLTTGSRLGAYDIVTQLGAGGMGEVYRAKDTKLGRDVALKILPASFTNDPERVARFRREAQVLASLNHPHIAQIHGLEEANGTQFLVLELVDGESLDKRIARGPIPVDEALGIAKQIAEGLEAAHEKGIIHRDLKPANIAVTNDGNVKVLDFGLAKALEPSSAGAADLTASPTITTPAMTDLGVILGTAAYMAPEQAKGKHVDRRADIWAFGVVLYEMLTGQRGYEAEDVSDTLAAVLTRDVNWSALPNVPPRLLALLRDCLVRDPKQRLRDIGDARRVLDQIIAGDPEPAAVIAPAQSQTRPSGAQALPWGVAAIALAGAAVLTFVHFRETPPTQQRVRFQISAPEKSLIGAFALSPDGRYLALTASGTFGMQGTSSNLWLRPIDSLDARAVPGTEGTGLTQDQVFWSPGSEFIGFVTRDGKVKKVSVNGGPPQTLVSSVSSITRGTWGRDGIILVAQGGPVQRVPDIGGGVADVTKKVDGLPQFQPHFLPDGRHFLYYVPGASSEVNGIYVASLKADAQAKRVLPDSTAAQYVPSDVPGRGGYLLFVRGTTLMAQPFDADTVTLTGQMFPVAERVGRFSVSQTGALAYMAGAVGRPFSRQELLWVDRTGRPLGVAAAAADYASVRLSPDEKSIAFSRVDEANNSDVWVLDLVRGVPSRITFDPAVDNLPIWSPDGRRILWPSRRSGNFDLYIKAASGTGQDENLITMGTNNGWATDWSHDGKFVLYQRPGDKTGQDLWIAPQSTGAPGEPQKPFPYLASPFNEANGVFSPDGHWIAYESDESGRPEVYVQAFPLTNQKVRISAGGGTDAAWSKNSGELFYLAADRNLMAVPYRATVTTFEPGAGKVLFAVPGNVIRRSYAVTGDGRRFLIGKPVDESINEPITLVLNWLEELKARVPMK